MLIRTAQGEAELQIRGTALSPKQRIALRLLDGKKNVADIQSYAGEERTVDSWYELIKKGYIQPEEMSRPPFSEYSDLQNKLTCVIICNLNEKASATFNIINNLEETSDGIAEALYKIERLVLMTIDETIVAELSRRMNEVIS